MKKELTAERLRELLDYDPETGVFRWKMAPSTKVRVGGVAGSQNSQGYVKIKLDLRDFLAHRLAWLYVTGEWPVGKLDHRDGVRSNNRLVNLRIASDTDNSRNRKAHANNALGLKGVRRHRYGRFEAQINIGKKSVYLGLFDTPDEAHAAYCKASAEFHGEFGRTK